MMKLVSKIYIHPFTYLLILLALLSGLFKYVFVIFIIVMIHETGHIFTSCVFKRGISKIEILPFGGYIHINSSLSSDIYEDLLISVSGIGMQLILFIIILLLHKYNFISNQIFNLINFYNTTIILFNLIPICPLDGYKMIKCILELFVPFKYTFLLSYIVSIIVFIVLIIDNYSVIKDNLLVFVFIIVSSLNEYKNRFNYMFRFYLERMIYSFNYSIRYIKNIDYMYKNNVHIIDGIYEKEYIKRSLFFSNNNL